MNSSRLVKISKYLSKHLRHQPERIGLTLEHVSYTHLRAHETEQDHV